MSSEIVTRDDGAAMVEKVLVGGDLSKLTATERLLYVQRICESLGLNPLTRPLEYLTLKGKLVLYARKDCTEQLRKIHNISLDKPEVAYADSLVRVTIGARTPAGRTDYDMGAVSIVNLKGEDLVNAELKAITKAKRRVTLSICGLGILDESEVETIAGAQFVDVHVNAPPQGQQRSLPAAEDTDLEPLRQEIEGYRTADPEGVRLVEHKYGPIPTWSRDTLVKAQAWFKERSEVAPQAEEEEADTDEADDDEQDDDEEYETVINDVSAFLAVVDKRNGNTTVNDIEPMQTILSAAQRLKDFPDEVPARHIASGPALLEALRRRVTMEVN